MTDRISQGGFQLNTPSQTGVHTQSHITVLVVLCTLEGWGMSLSAHMEVSTADHGHRIAQMHPQRYTCAVG